MTTLVYIYPYAPRGARSISLWPYTYFRLPYHIGLWASNLYALFIIPTNIRLHEYERIFSNLKMLDLNWTVIMTLASRRWSYIHPNYIHCTTCRIFSAKSTSESTDSSLLVLQDRSRKFCCKGSSKCLYCHMQRWPFIVYSMSRQLELNVTLKIWMTTW